ncbi:MAG: hypothetical protein PHD04_04285 [Candidatus Pacebacteria bacterium]|nr:hypothetical protein [Candidatus Paceibacterota bacterium]
MITQQDEVKIAIQLGLEIRKGEHENLYIGSIEQIQEFNRLCGVLDEQYEQEAEIIRENKKDD